MNDEKALERLKQIHDEHGILRPEDVVKDARNPKSPLHSYFEWDKIKAHQRFLIIQARDLIRSVRLVVEKNERQYKVIGYVRDPDLSSDEQGYTSTATLKTDKQRARDALMLELKRAEAALSRAYEVADSLDLSDEVSLLLARLRNTMQSA